MKNFGEITSFHWSIAELLRDSFKRSKYQDVILPLTVLHRIDCVLEPTEREVLSATVRDQKDGQVGKVGYEINFNRHFYEYQPPRPLEEIEAEIHALEEEILTVLARRRI